MVLTAQFVLVQVSGKRFMGPLRAGLPAGYPFLDAA